MNNWLEDTLNGFLIKVGLPAQQWHLSSSLTLQFDGDITCEIVVLDESLSINFLVPVFASSQSQVLQHLCGKNPLQFQKTNHFCYHWFNNQAVVQTKLKKETVTEILLEQAFTSLLNESQTIKAM